MDFNKPTSQMLGRFQPFHNGHVELFKKMHAETGQVVIMIRSQELDGSNPYLPATIKEFIKLKLNMFTYDRDYVIMVVPNITNIGYGRDVGYSITQYDLGEEIHKISATEIRNASKHRTNDITESSD
tara:strand:- start:1045 stop:1425 length:381 start_codon:yes stop_codon:yes gene_type:complete